MWQQHLNLQRTYTMLGDAAGSGRGAAAGSGIPSQNFLPVDPNFRETHRKIVRGCCHVSSLNSFRSMKTRALLIFVKILAWLLGGRLDITPCTYCSTPGSTQGHVPTRGAAAASFSRSVARGIFSPTPFKATLFSFMGMNMVST